ncbi:glutathione S-transferase family protein [Fulvimonas yonginensis]|uniref:Glutathione S-transferase family protein n=1 Tax=Fulvimonas yonginensis TaxID=1495200 RepID=A0ABU8JA94_9GAMM
MYTLYYAPGAASMVVHLALLEAGAPYDLRLVDLDAGAQRDPAYLALNPHGVVPTLVVDGRPLGESSALLMLLAERHPEAGLAPAPGTPGRGAWYAWIAYLASTLMPPFRLWFYPQDLHDTPDVRAAVQRRIEGVWDHLQAHLATQGPHLLGEQFSGADLLLTMLMRWSRNMPRPATQWPALAQLADRVRARPSWRRLYEIEGLREW